MLVEVFLYIDYVGVIFFAETLLEMQEMQVVPGMKLHKNLSNFGSLCSSFIESTTSKIRRGAKRGVTSIFNGGRVGNVKLYNGLGIPSSGYTIAIIFLGAYKILIFKR